MSIYRRVLDRIADWRWTGRKINLRFVAEYRTACFAVPNINRILAEDDDGETYRAALTDWRKAERPPLALYHGTSSFCRIDGPRQWVKDRSFPLGGLILSPGVTAHLDPFEARELQEHMEWAVEQAVRQWIADRDLHDLPPVPVEFDRRKADRKAKAKIGDWAAPQALNRPVADDDAEGPNHAEPERRKAVLQGCDATHRARNMDTHLTHGCIQLFRGFDEMLIASPQMQRRRNGAIPPFHAMADSISPGAPR